MNAWRFFQAVSGVFDASNKALRDYWHARLIARDMWLAAGGCEQCAGTGFTSAAAPCTCHCAEEGYTRIQTLGADPLLTEADIGARRDLPRHVLTLGPYTVAPDNALTATAATHCRFRGDLLLNTGDEEGLSLTMFTVGQRLQLTHSPSEIPLSMFRVDNPLSRMLIDETRRHNNLGYEYINISVRNRTTQPKTFSMTIAGRVTYDPPTTLGNGIGWSEINGDEPIRRAPGHGLSWDEIQALADER